MKKLVMACLTLALAPIGLAAQDDPAGISALPLGLTVTADLVSTYTFRGANVSDAPAIQPGASIALGNTGVSFSVWGSFAILDRSETLPYSASLTRSGVDELNLVASYSRAVGPVSVGAGYIGYLFPSDEQDFSTQELYASVGATSVPLAPTLTAYYDFDESDDVLEDPDVVEGAYVSLGVSHALDVGKEIGLAANVGWTNQEALRTDAGLHDLSLSAGVPFQLRGLMITPTIAYAHILKDSSFYGDESKGTLWAKVQVLLGN